MTDDLAGFWTHDVAIERYLGPSAYGASYDTPTTVTGFVDDGQRLVAGANGDQVTSTALLFLPITTVDVPLQSRVTLPAAFGGRIAEVIAVARRHSGGLPLPEHLELALL